MSNWGSTNLPEPISELIGRDAQLDEILTLCDTQRLVTLAGAGGIGKTRLGFEVARHQLPNFAGGVWAVELAPLSDPDLVPVTVATALGVELAPRTTSPQSVAYALRSRQLMLLLDNCEHVIDAAARMAEALLRVNPAARVIATSRSARLDDRFRLLTTGRRTALPRHQTLRATLDWSYELLTEPEQIGLRRLAIFAGGFTLRAARTVAVVDEIAAVNTGSGRVRAAL
jgi:predicted ATPase